MSQEIRRLHRKTREFTNFSSELPELPSSTESIESSTQPDFNDAYSLQSQMTNSHPTASTNDINSIRAEFLEDAYHSELNESDFSDDTHDWDGDSQQISSDYWHFLGRYE